MNNNIDIDYDIITSIGNLEGLLKFITKYKDHIDFSFRENENAKSIFEYTFLRILNFSKNKSNKQNTNIITDFFLQKPEIFNENYSFIIKNNKDYFISLYKNNKDSFSIKITEDYNYDFNDFLIIEDRIDNYYNFINSSTDVKVIQYLVEKNKIDFKQQRPDNNIPFFEEFIRNLINDQINNNNKQISSNIKNILAYLKKENMLNDIIINEDFLSFIIKSANNTKISTTNAEFLYNIFISSKNLKPETLLDTNFLTKHNFNYKLFSNNEKYFKLLNTITENDDFIKKNIEVIKNNIKNEHIYLKSISKIYKKPSEVNYEILIKKSIHSIIESGKFNNTNLSDMEFLFLFKENIIEDNDITTKLKNDFNFSDFNDSTFRKMTKNQIFSTYDFYISIFNLKTPNLCKLINIVFSNGKKTQNMQDFLNNTNIEELEYVKKSQPKFYKEFFENNSGLIKRTPKLMIMLEKIILESSIKENLSTSKNIKRL